MKSRWVLLLAVVLALSVAGIASAAQLNLKWQDLSTNETGFNIERKVEACVGTGTFSQLAQVGTNVIAYSDSAVIEGNSYCYRLNAYNGAGVSAWSNTAGRGIPYTVASAPTGLTVTAAGLLSWTDKTPNESGFVVQRKVEACAGTGGTFAQVVSVPANQVSWTDNSVVQGNTYCYRVAATNTLGNSPYSNTVERIVPLVIPAVPGLLEVELVP